MFLGEQAAEKDSYADCPGIVEGCACPTRPNSCSCSRVRVRLEFSITFSRTRSRGFCLASKGFLSSVNQS